MQEGWNRGNVLKYCSFTCILTSWMYLVDIVTVVDAEKKQQQIIQSWQSSCIDKYLTIPYHYKV